MNGFEPFIPSDGVLSINGFSPFNPNAGEGAIKRIFIDNDDAAGAFSSMATPIVMAGNFTAGTKAILPLSATNYTLIGQTASSLNYLKILSTGFASTSIDGDVVSDTERISTRTKIGTF